MAELGLNQRLSIANPLLQMFKKRIGSKEVLPELFINSINMYKLFQLLTNGQKEDLIDYLADAVQKLKNVGADFVMLSGNTPYIVFAEIQQKDEGC